MTPKPRYVKDLRRRPARFEPRARILIVCEGEKTEPQYFESMKRELQLTSVVVIQGKECGRAPIEVVNHAIDMRRKAMKDACKEPYEVVWCVMDVEAPHPDATLAGACNKARDNKLKLALTNPCFEYWFLLHFKKTGAPFQKNEDVLRKLRQELRKHSLNYEKDDKLFFHVVYPRTRTAMKNTKEISNEMGWSDDLRKSNPSTHVHKLVKYLHKIVEKDLPGS